MSSLFRRSVIFADVRNVVVSYDTIVATRLARYFKDTASSRYFFKKELDDIMEMAANELVFHIMAEKVNRNFLMDYFNWSILDKVSASVSPTMVCDKVYTEALRLPVLPDDVLENPDISGLMTSIGKSFQVLCADVNLDTLYLYLEPGVPEEIKKGLSFFYMGNAKIKFITGDRDQLKVFFDTTTCDSYFFEESTDIDAFIAKPHPHLSEVLIPGNKANLSIVDKIENTNLRMPVLDMDLEDYKTKFNLEIHTIGLPI